MRSEIYYVSAVDSAIRIQLANYYILLFHSLLQSGCAVLVFHGLEMDFTARIVGWNFNSTSRFSRVLQFIR